jgi:D-amino-acid oxidase
VSLNPGKQRIQSKTPISRYPCARPEETQDVLERILVLCPELAPQEIRAVRSPKVEDLHPLIVDELVGLRPARHGGVRLEVEWVAGRGEGQKVPVIHNYG